MVFRNIARNNILAASNIFMNIKEKIIEQYWSNEMKNDVDYRVNN